ncbi:unnamed protein product [Diabrotica balteata]|uniref:Uncharacterized protein n=1 Tax=Diabrotica balteata TaxID=107213 RepID=A0A9N9ST66_DIABA|nr:unnamed protein product [Diabrotica balteata]
MCSLCTGFNDKYENGPTFDEDDFYQSIPDFSEEDWTIETNLHHLNTNHHPNRITPTTLYEWSYVNFTWNNPEQYTEAINTKRYIPQNLLIGGIRFFENDMYMSLPKYRPGVPATLTVVPKADSKSTNVLMTPFPSWEKNDDSDCDNLQNVLGIEIDTKVGKKQGHTDGMMIDTDNTLYYTLIDLYGIGKWNFDDNFDSSEVIYRNRTSHYLVLLTLLLPITIYGDQRFPRKSLGASCRKSIPNKASSAYMKDQIAYSKETCPDILDPCHLLIDTDTDFFAVYYNHTRPYSLKLSISFKTALGIEKVFFEQSEDMFRAYTKSLIQNVMQFDGISWHANIDETDYDLMVNFLFDRYSHFHYKLKTIPEDENRNVIELCVKSDGSFDPAKMLVVHVAY